MFLASECRRIFRNPARRRSSYPFCEPSPMRCNCVRAWWARAASSRGGRGRRSVCDCSRGAYGDGRGRTDGDGAAVAYSIHAGAAPNDGPTALGATAINRAASTCKFFPFLLWRALRVAFPNSNQQKFRITQ